VRSSFVYDKACLEATTKAQPTPDGSKQVIPVRLAAEQVKKIAKLAELQGVDRSTICAC